jgi:glycosidase
LNNRWAQPDVRDNVVDYVRKWSDKTEIAATKMVNWIGILAANSMTGSFATAKSMSTIRGFHVTSGLLTMRNRRLLTITKTILWKAIGG